MDLFKLDSLNSKLCKLGFPDHKTRAHTEKIDFVYVLYQKILFLLNVSLNYKLNFKPQVE